MKLLLLAILVGLLSVAWHRPVATSTWTEDWSDISDWQYQGNIPSCFANTPGSLIGVCFSSGLYSRAKWDRRYPVTIQGQVMVEPASPHNQAWGGIKLVNGWYDSNDDALCQFAFLGQSMGMSYDGVVANWGGIVYCYAQRWPPASPGIWHDYKIAWKPSVQRWYFYVDGVYRYAATARPLTGDLRAKEECVAAHPGVSGDGELARCEFGPLTVTGVRLK